MDGSLGRRFWMIAFFLALLAFEFMRELYVFEVNEPKHVLGPSLLVEGDGDFAHAEGVWRRSDGGSPIVAGAVVIECYRESGTCFEANSTVLTRPLMIHSTLDAQRITQFDSKAVAFESTGACAVYRVRIDLEQRRVTATRDKNADAPAATCANLERRVVMEMADGSVLPDSDLTWTKDHVLPILRVIWTVAR